LRWSFCDKFVAAAFLPDTAVSIRSITILSGFVMPLQTKEFTGMTKHRRIAGRFAIFSPDFDAAGTTKLEISHPSFLINRLLAGVRLSQKNTIFRSAKLQWSRLQPTPGRSELRLNI